MVEETLKICTRKFNLQKYGNLAFFFNITYMHIPKNVQVGVEMQRYVVKLWGTCMNSMKYLAYINFQLWSLMIDKRISK